MIYISIAVANSPSRPSAFSQNIEFSFNYNLDHTDNGYSIAKNPALGPINIVKIQRASPTPCVFISMPYFPLVKNNISILIEKQAKMALIIISIFKAIETKSPIKYEINRLKV